MYPYYDPKIFERVNIALIDLFDKIEINRYNPDGTIHKIIRVPVTIHFSKNFADFVLNTQDKPESKHTTPILGLRMGTPQRNVAGITSSSYIREIYDTKTKRVIRDRRPSPWTWTYTLTAYCESIYDHHQIMQNIMPYFDPYFNVRLKEFEFSNLKRDVIVELTGVSPQYNDELDREKARTYVCEYTFAVKFDMYTPIYFATLIKEINDTISIRKLPVAKITNVELDNITIEEYERKLNEIVETGKLVNTIIVSKSEPTAENESRKFVDTVDGPIIDITTLPAKAKITHVELSILEASNSRSAVASVGFESNNAAIMSSRDSNLYLYTRYSLDVNVALDKEETIKIFFDRSGATLGQFEVLIRWTV